MASSNHDVELAPSENERLIELCNEIGLNFNSVKETFIKLDRNGHVIELVIGHSMATRLPPNFGSFFPQLRKLRIMHCRNLTDISPIGGCRLLEDLDLCGCRRLELASEFWRITTLRRLVLYCLDIREISPGIGNLTDLEYLSVLNCSNLRTFPPEVGLLSKLKDLGVLYCHELTGLPDTIGDLNELETVTFWECSNLSDVPLSFWKLPCLEEVNVWGPQTLREVSVPATIEEFSTSIQQLGSDYARDDNSWQKLCHCVMLNRAGRCLLHKPHVPDALWSNVFGRCNTASDAAASLNALYFFLREKPKLVNASQRKSKLRNE